MTDAQDWIRPAFAQAQWLRRKEVFLQRRTPEPLAKLLAGNRDFQRILDCGTGIGSLIKHLLDLIRWVEAVGVDRNGDLLVHHAYPALGGKEGVRLLQGDVTNLRALRAVSASGVDDDATHRLDDETFDLVLSQELLEHVALPVTALREMWRVVKPGGTFLCLHNEVGEIFLEPAHELDGKVLDNFYKYIFGGTSDKHCGRKLWALASEAGLPDFEISGTPWLLYPPYRPEEQLTLQYIVENFFCAGSAHARIPIDKWEEDGIADPDLENWRRDRLRQIDRGGIVFHADALSLSATKSSASRSRE